LAGVERWERLQNVRSPRPMNFFFGIEATTREIEPEKRELLAKKAIISLAAGEFWDPCGTIRGFRRWLKVRASDQP
jgi:hypothetical protein